MTIPFTGTVPADLIVILLSIYSGYYKNSDSYRVTKGCFFWCYTMFSISNKNSFNYLIDGNYMWIKISAKCYIIFYTLL